MVTCFCFFLGSHYLQRSHSWTVYNCSALTIWPTMAISELFTQELVSPGKQRLHALLRFFLFQIEFTITPLILWLVTDKNRKSCLLTCRLVCIRLHSAYFQLEYVVIQTNGKIQYKENKDGGSHPGSILEFLTEP